MQINFCSIREFSVCAMHSHGWEMVLSSLCKEPLKVTPGVNKLLTLVVLSILIQLIIIYLNPRPPAAVGLTLCRRRVMEASAWLPGCSRFSPWWNFSGIFSPVLTQVLSPDDWFEDEMSGRATGASLGWDVSIDPTQWGWKGPEHPCAETGIPLSPILGVSVTALLRHLCVAFLGLTVPLHSP